MPQSPQDNSVPRNNPDPQDNPNQQDNLVPQDATPQDAPLKSRESLFQAIKFTILSLSAGGIEASLSWLDKLTAWSRRQARHLHRAVRPLNFTLNRPTRSNLQTTYPSPCLKWAFLRHLHSRDGLAWSIGCRCRYPRVHHQGRHHDLELCR